MTEIEAYEKGKTHAIGCLQSFIQGLHAMRKHVGPANEPMITAESLITALEQQTFIMSQLTIDGGDAKVEGIDFYRVN